MTRPETAAQGPADQARSPGWTADQVDADLDRVDAALAHLEAGTYGRCERCQAVIDDALLASDPTLARCPAHVQLPAGT